MKPFEMTIGTESYEGRLNTPRSETDTGVLILPGAGHGPFGDIFDIIAYELAEDGKQVLRFESWENHDQLGEKTLEQLHSEIDAGVERLQSEGCTTIYLLAKSFGGGLALTHIPDSVERVVLWEPYIDLVEDSAESAEPTEPIGSPDALTITPQKLGQIETPARILCGDGEPGMSSEFCEQLVDALGHGEMTIIPEENHSFNRNRAATVQRTLEYLP